ncbi:MAG TPA: hypothetical protein VFB22_02525 [Candidatus Baltobacteraceae bacterium]|nr:hypothetical protein [Candidatus Baltobacteraceae bacterium]
MVHATLARRRFRTGGARSDGLRRAANRHAPRVRAALSGTRLARIALALFVLAFFFYAALSHRVYRHTLPYRVIAAIFGEDQENFAATVIRKLYSVVAFTVVGVAMNLSLPPSRRRTLWTVLAVAAFSACIEVAQKLHHAREGFGSNLFDVGCGALGGWLGALIVNGFRRRRLAAARAPRLRR